VFLTSLVFPSYIITTAQLNPPEPTTAHWYVQEGNRFSWYVTKLRENGNVTSIQFFYNYTTESINVTEGNTITITVLTLGNASEFEGTCRIQTGGEQHLTRIANLAFWVYPLIFPIYNRDYWVDFIALYENQTLTKYTLEGNVLTANSSSPNSYYKVVLDISTGLCHSLYYLDYSNQMELKIDLMTGFLFPNISLPTLLLAGVIGAEIIVAIFLVRLFRRRRLELGK
jgi:hypothetical protein